RPNSGNTGSIMCEWNAWDVWMGCVPTPSESSAAQNRLSASVGPDTTVIDGPLRPDGTIDYAAAINDEWAAGVTPDQNAAVDLLRAFGPGTIMESVRGAYFARLQIPVPPLEGDYLIDLAAFLDSQGITRQQDPEQFDELIDQQGQATSSPWAAESFPQMAAWLKANEVPLEAIIQAAAKPRYFSPLVPPDDSPVLGSSMNTEMNVREAARLLMAQAMLELGNGNIDRAFELTLACHRLARLVSEHPTLIGAMISVAVETMAAQGDAAIVLDDRLTGEQASDFRRRLKSLPPPRSIADVYDRGERFMSLDMTLAMATGRITEEDLQIPRIAFRMGFDPNPTLRRFNEYYDATLQILQISDPEERTQAFWDLDARIEEHNKKRGIEWWLRMLVHAKRGMSEAIGNVLVTLLIPTGEQAATASDRRFIRLEFCDVGYALAEFRAANGHFPDTLEELVPDDLDAVPLDFYTGDPLKYRRTDAGFVLYSVGENGIDDGGFTVRNRDDIAFGDVPQEEAAE
ncbi:MAG: hypothetical protein KF861_20220, partial [Planctomycetaceae bacterium]|nr:hypothetical protein [Planctomycetaceae bacterium]